MKKYALAFAWIVSVIATLGSLYFSEIRMYDPCKLCWLQRIFMYPLTIILGIAVFKNENFIAKYAQPLSIIGWIIALWHVLQQKVPGFANILPCKVGVPCSVDYINWLDFITIPVLSLIAFTFINVFLFIVKKSEKK